MAKKMSYAEQLKHPNWQRVRLQRLEAADFECEYCGTKEKTLHVHHKQYFKGRMAWEYSHDELEVLCEDCHEVGHQHDDLIKKAFVNNYPLFAMIAGRNINSFALSEDELDVAFKHDPYDFMTGAIAHLLSSLTLEDMYKVAEFAVSLTREESEERMILKHSKYFKQIGDLNG